MNMTRLILGSREHFGSALMSKVVGMNDTAKGEVKTLFYTYITGKTSDSCELEQLKFIFMLDNLATLTLHHLPTVHFRTICPISLLICSLHRYRISNVLMLLVGTWVRNNSWNGS